VKRSLLDAIWISQGREVARRRWQTAKMETAGPQAPAAAQPRKRVRNAAASTVTEKRQAVVDLFLERGCDVAPPTLVVPDSVCSQCGRSMCVLVEGSLIGCRACQIVRAVPPQSFSVSEFGNGAGGGSSSRFAGSTYIQRVTHGNIHLLQTRDARLRGKLWVAQAKIDASNVSEELIDQTCRFILNRNLVPELTSPETLAEIRAVCVRRNRWTVDSFAEVEAHFPARVVNLLRTEISGVLVRHVRRVMPKEIRDKYKSYDDCAYIAAELSGLLPPQMTPDVEQKVLDLCRIAAPMYGTSTDGKRTAFAGGYDYLIYSVLLLLGYDEFLSLFTIPKVSPEREDQRRDIWEKLHWDWIPIADAGPPPVEVRKGGADSGREAIVAQERAKRADEVMVDDEEAFAARGGLMRRGMLRRRFRPFLLPPVPPE
jgi:hypothetical protein